MAILNTGLSVSDIVNVTVSLTAAAASERNFGSLLILGDSGVISTTERMRSYASLAAVAVDFGSGPEYQAAAIYFGQVPQPSQVYIGAWARINQSGRLVGSVLGASAQVLSTFTAVSAGTLSITIDGNPHTLTALNFSAAANLSAVAGILSTALGGAATATWSPSNAQFTLTSATTGAASSVAFPVTSGSDISALFGFEALQGAYLSPGIVAETALQAATLFATLSGAWYGLMFAASVMPSISDNVAVAGLIAGLSTSHIYGVSSQDATVLNATSNQDVASQVDSGRTFVQYSASSPYAAAAVFGRAFTVDFNGIGTVITLKFQEEDGITPETLTETQAATLSAKNCNVFVQYNNGVAILQQGVMSNGTFIDVVQGTDWLQNAIQTSLFNLLTSVGKVPQTDAGVNKLLTNVVSNLEQAVINGLVAPGVWNGPDVGSISTGQTLPTGYYVYAAKISTQSPAVRATRAAPVIQAAIKLAGAIHSVSVILSVNP